MWVLCGTAYSGRPICGALHERARAYEKTSFKGVFSFLRFLEQMQENQADLEPARVLSDNENVVRIMSIHKSKGLEFPIVFIGGLGRRFNFRDAQQEFLLHKDYGLAFSAVDGQLEIKYPTIAQRVIAQKKRLEVLQEEKRVLYVAMTRARERLYLLGSCADAEKKERGARGKSPVLFGLAAAVAAFSAVVAGAVHSGWQYRLCGE